MPAPLRIRGRLSAWWSRLRRTAPASDDLRPDVGAPSEPSPPADSAAVVSPVDPAAAALSPPYVAPVRPETQGAALPVATSGYGRRHPDPALYPHRWGVDISLPTSWRVRAIGPAVVTHTTDLSDPYNGIACWYRLSTGPWQGHTHVALHLSACHVSVGQQLEAGEVIGLSGSTGQSTGPHLHAENQDSAGLAPGDPMDPHVIDWRGAGWTWEGWND